MPTDSHDLVEPKNVTMYPIHWAVVDAYAKDMGYNSTSAALRRIVDEWVDLKYQGQRPLQLVDTQPEYTVEETVTA